MKDYYNDLGVQKTATQDEIKAAYRRLSAEKHPDKPGGNEAEFRTISEAYEILGDAAKRREYDESQSQKPIENLSDVVREVVGEYFDNLNNTPNTTN